MLMARDNQCGDVGVRGGRRITFGESKVMIGRQVVGRIVAPFALEETVGGRQQLQSVDAEFAEIGPAGLQNREPLEIRATHGFVHQRADIAERADAPLLLALRLRAGPRGRQLVNHQVVVGREGSSGTSPPNSGFSPPGSQATKRPAEELEHSGRLIAGLGS